MKTDFMFFYGDLELRGDEIEVRRMQQNNLDIRRVILPSKTSYDASMKKGGYLLIMSGTGIVEAEGRAMKLTEGDMYFVGDNKSARMLNPNPEPLFYLITEAL